MATLRFLLKRFAAQRLLGLAVVVTLAFSVGVLVAGPIYADAAREAILSSQLAGAAPTVRNARLQVFGDETFDWAAADQAITDRTESLPVQRIVRQGLGTVRLGSTDGPSVAILAREGFEEHLEIRGEEPGEDEVVLHAGVAQLLGVHAGDRLAAIGPTGEEMELTVTGTYVSPDPNDPYLVRFAEPVPGPRLHAAAAGAGESRHDRWRDAGARPHDPVFLGRVPGSTGVPFDRVSGVPDQTRRSSRVCRARPGSA